MEDFTRDRYQLRNARRAVRTLRATVTERARVPRRAVRSIDRYSRSPSAHSPRADPIFAGDRRGASRAEKEEKEFSRVSFHDPLLALRGRVYRELRTLSLDHLRESLFCARQRTNVVCRQTGSRRRAPAAGIETRRSGRGRSPMRDPAEKSQGIDVGGAKWTTV